MSDVKVLQIPRGSLIVMNGVDFPHDSGMMDDLMAALKDRSGHDEFVILNIGGDGTAEVFGSVEEAVDRVRAALDEAGIS